MELYNITWFKVNYYLYYFTDQRVICLYIHFTGLYIEFLAKILKPKWTYIVKKIVFGHTSLVGHRTALSFALL